ncbi:MAG: ABC transporter ATP-binding protein [Bacteroidota bacterium]|nr:ABC transporter ATP-binding protein [Bacteroidota bacterium]
MIQFQNVLFQYSRKKPLFKELDLQLQTGNMYGLLGRNGAGKTTLLRLINGLVFPNEGSCSVMGYTPEDRHPTMLADIFFVQEEPFIPNMTILSYLYTYAPFYPNFDFDKFFTLLTDFELEGGLNMEKLSFGQKKKVLLCFAVATNSKILILDEPTNGLDIPSKSQFRKLMTEAMMDERMIIISTHQVRDMVNLIDPILIVENGKIIFQHSIEEISNALVFETINTMNEPQNVLYSERVMGGYATLTENTKGTFSDVDIEVLFNAVLTKKDEIISLLRKKNQ